MYRTVSLYFASALLLLSAGSVNAIVLSFDPAAQHAGVGEAVGVDVRISGLGAGSAPSLGAFDLDVTFDDTILDFTGLTFGDQLDLFGLGSITGFAENPDPAVGLIDFFEISLDSPFALDELQADSFVLATLLFDAAAAGVGSLGFGSSVFADSFGAALVVDTSGAGRVSVPEPATAALLALGLAGLLWRRQSRRAR